MLFPQLLMVAAKSCHSLACRYITVISASLITWCPSCMSVSLFSQKDTGYIGLRPTLMQYGPKLIIAAKTLFPNTVKFIDTRGQDFNISFGGNTVQPITGTTVYGEVHKTAHSDHVWEEMNSLTCLEQSQYGDIKSWLYSCLGLGYETSHSVQTPGSESPLHGRKASSWNSLCVVVEGALDLESDNLGSIFSNCCSVP